MIPTFHDPFAVLLVAHPDAGEATRELVQSLERWLTATVPGNLLVAGSNLPTYLFLTPPELAHLTNPSTRLAERLAVVVLADDPLAGDQTWQEWTTELFAADRASLVPMLWALTPSAGCIANSLPLILTDVSRTTAETLEQVLVPITAGLLCALPLPHGITTQTTLLISHDTRSAEAIALADLLLAHIDASQPTDHYFTRVSFTPRFTARNPITDDNFRDAAVVIIHTDNYSANAWCQHDVLSAKRHHCPALIVDARRCGEARQFPHLGGIRVLREPSGVPAPWKIVAHILRESLFDQHTALLLDALRDVTLIPDAVTFTRPPEFATLAELAPHLRHPAPLRPEIIIYPDPPMARDEIDLLRCFVEAEFLTLTQAIATTGGSGRPLMGRRIALSISNSPDLARNGRTQGHLERAWIALARHLLDAGATLAFGGDLRRNGFTTALADLVRAYAEADAGLPTDAVRLYLTWPTYREYAVSSQVNAEEFPSIITEMGVMHEFAAGIEPILCVPPDDIDLAPAPDTPEDRYSWTRTLTAMREKMAEETDGRLLLGGQHRSMGLWPGLAEEAIAHLRCKKPVYLLGGYGGLTSILIDAIERRRTKFLSGEPQDGSCGSANVDRAYFEARAPQNIDRVDLSALVEEFGALGPEGLRNGLALDENRRLFATPSLFEQVALVLHGLRNVRPISS